MAFETNAGILGDPPTLLIQPVFREEDGESAKYTQMWSHPEYRKFSPGENSAATFLKLASPSKGENIIDFGCGTGRGSLMLALLGFLKVTMVDFAKNCLDQEVQDMLVTQSHALNFVEADLRKPIPANAKYGYCTDVMEHIPPEDVEVTLKNILQSAQHVFFQICTQPDHMGVLIGESLHLTVQPHDWWLAKLRDLGAIVHWAGYDEYNASFYVTAWNAATELVKLGTINVESETIEGQIRSSIARTLKSVTPHEVQDTPIMILGGGASLDNYLEDIKAKRDAGYKLITTNGSYNWALKNGLVPSAQIVVDAREFNNRFVQPAQPSCAYLIASQCHPSVFEALPAQQVWLWHSALSDTLCDILDKHYWGKNEAWYPVMGGSTVMLRAIPLLRLLGFKKMDIYGFDSCIMDGEHHAYKQEENDHTTVLSITCGDRVFQGHPWMISQAQEFLDLMQILAEEIELEIHGDGLIHYILETGAIPEIVN